MRARIMLAVLILTATTAIMAAADTHHYLWHKESGEWIAMGRAGTEESFWGEVVLCYSSGVCTPPMGPGLWCIYCHSQPVDQKRYASDKEQKHRRIYYPKYSLPLMEGQQTAFDAFTVFRSRGVLIVQDQQGRRFQLPPDALLVKGKDGQPRFITYMGKNPPQPIK